MLKALAEKIKFKTVFIDFDDDSKMYRWKVILGGQSFDYQMGSAHFTPPTNKNGRRNYKPKGIESIAHNPSGDGWNRGWIHCPDFKGVLYSLRSDGQCGEDTHQDFCDNMGYDIDSRKGLEIYLACQVNGNAFRGIFTSDELKLIDSQLEDY